MTIDKDVGKARVSFGLPDAVVEKARGFLATVAGFPESHDRDEGPLLALLAELRASTVEELLGAVESLARQATREEASAALRESRYRSPAVARAEAETWVSRPGTSADPPPAGDLGARLDANIRDRHGLIDEAIVTALRARADGEDPWGLSTDVARALEAQGAYLQHVEVVDGLLRLVRAARVTTRSGFYGLVEVAPREARA